MSNNLGLTQLSSSQNNKETTINDTNAEIDAAISDVLTVTVDNSNAATVTQAELQRAFILDIQPDGGTPPTAAITITVGTAFERGAFVTYNNTSEEVTVEVSGQSATPPTLAAGEASIMILDGTEVVQLASTAISSLERPYDVGAFFGGSPTASQVIFTYVAVRAFDLPANATDSEGFLGTAATAQTDFDIQKNGVSIGTMRFAAAGTTATFVSVSATSFAAGDRLSIIAPGTPDATAADLSVTLKMSRA